MYRDNNNLNAVLKQKGEFELGKRDQSLFDQIEELSSLNKVQGKPKLDLKRNFKKPDRNERNDSKKFSRAETTLFTNIYQVKNKL